MAFELPPLPYPYDGLEPHIDARTVEIHYTKHHATYLKNLNAALEKHPEFFNQTIESILSTLDKIPEDIRTIVKNNGGGYHNHNLYWENMGPGQGGQPHGKVKTAIDSTFGNFNAFKEQLEKTGVGRLGSGYAWLSKKADGSLLVHATLNQDSPLSEGLKPLLVVDVWEHAYYLKYQNRRAEYLTNWWNLVNWDVVEKRFTAA
jgi:superoxide dismutase, Fe-Mn family